MKIAVGFFGITRNLRAHTLESIEKCLFAPVARLDPAFKKFAHFNRVPCVFNPRSGEQNVAIDPEEFKSLNCDVVSCTDQDWLDAHLDYPAIQKFGDDWGDNFYSLRNLMRQLYSLDQLSKLLLQAKEPFDLVIYSRADLRFLKPVPLPRIRPRTIYTPWFGKSGGLNDRFALGDLPSMVLYGQRQSMMRQYCEALGKPLHGERLLAWWLKKHRLRTRDLTSIEFCRVRANGTIPSPDVNPKAKLKYRFKHAVSRLRNLAVGQDA